MLIALRRRSLFLIVPLTLTVLSFGLGQLLTSLGVRLPVIVALIVANLLLASLPVGVVLWITFSIIDGTRPKGPPMY